MSKLVLQSLKIIMKTLSTLLFLLTINVVLSQSGKIYPKNESIKIGDENTYIYKPSKTTELPENAVVNVIFDRNKTSFPLIKKGNKFEFSIKAPASMDVLIMTVSDKSNNIVDNNAEQGFVVYLQNKTEEEKLQSQLSYLSVCDMANYLLNLNINTANAIEKFDAIYDKNPQLKQGDNYSYYLFLKYQKDAIASKPEILAEAEKLSRNDDEKSLMMASTFYAMLKMQTESQKIDALARLKFPNGELAKRKFMNELYADKNKTEASILASLKAYIEKFNDDSPQSKDQFYTMIIQIYLEKEDLQNLDKYENLLSDNQIASYLYNEYAWGLSGQDLTSSGTSLPFAAAISKRSITIIEDHMKMNNPALLQGMHNTFADTYALILYKQKNYDLAFDYEDVLKKNGGLDTGGKERYAAIAEKAKGPEFAKEYIEAQLLAGVDSKILMNQLQEIYKNLNLPSDEFELVKRKSVQLAMLKSQEEIISMFGDAKAIDFDLVNLEGKKVKLSDYKGKMVVLDFWATWCGPCRASFPNMQKLVTKYKNENVEFFFINTWEHNDDAQILENVSRFIKENNYTFNVLFDFEDDVVAEYKVLGIPTKIVIDKNGDIVSINSSESNLEAIIDESIEIF